MPKKVICRDAGYDCDFEVKSEDVDEVIEFTQRHAKGTHDMELSRTDTEGLLKDA